ncbi:MAG: hypothetical protein PHT15_07985, partial [Gallionellaceae bacterium]|nr:hypothetical protein [Gallionellaceae bacterium]
MYFTQDWGGFTTTFGMKVFVAAPSRLSMHFGLWRGREFAAKLRVDVLGILLFLGRGNKVS